MAKSVDQLTTELNTELDAATARIQEDVKNYEDRIAALQASQGTLTAAQEQALEDLKAKLAAIDPTNPNVLP
jgi:uncharacterized protein YlxW (UPF0749 family)